MKIGKRVVDRLKARSIHKYAKTPSPDFYASKLNHFCSVNKTTLSTGSVAPIDLIKNEANGSYNSLNN